MAAIMLSRRAAPLVPGGRTSGSHSSRQRGDAGPAFEVAAAGKPGAEVGHHHARVHRGLAWSLGQVEMTVAFGGVRGDRCRRAASSPLKRRLRSLDPASVVLVSGAGGGMPSVPASAFTSSNTLASAARAPAPATAPSASASDSWLANPRLRLSRQAARRTSGPSAASRAAAPAATRCASRSISEPRHATGAQPGVERESQDAEQEPLQRDIEADDEKRRQHQPAAAAQRESDRHRQMLQAGDIAQVQVHADAVPGAAGRGAAGREGTDDARARLLHFFLLTLAVTAIVSPLAVWRYGAPGAGGDAAPQRCAVARAAA
ncbi:MAG: hypothetical protein U1F67_08660 [Rubrivivax sp.]